MPQGTEVPRAVLAFALKGGNPGYEAIGEVMLVNGVNATRRKHDLAPAASRL